MRAAARLVALGYRYVFEYPGGWKEWAGAGGVLEHGGAPAVETEAPHPA